MRGCIRIGTNYSNMTYSFPNPDMAVFLNEFVVAKETHQKSVAI